MTRRCCTAVLLLTTCAWSQSPGSVFTTEPQRSAFAVTPRTSAAVTVVDIDGDGIRDAVLAGPSIQWGTGSGFEPVQDLGGGYPTGAEIVSPAVAFDCDGDGDMDLLQPSSGGIQRSLWRNQSGRTFVDATATALAAVPVGFDTVHAAADVDGDGDLDVLGDLGSVWINDGTGVFQDETSVRNPGMPAGAARGLLVVVDVDGDGDQDFLVRAGLLRNDGNGGFAFDGTLAHDQGSPIAVVAVDVDRDGDQDLLTSVGALLRNDGSGGFARETFVLDGVRDAGDLDGDGLVDLLLIPNAAPARPSWAPGGAAGFGAPRPLPFVGTTNELDPTRWRVQLVDAEGDGDLDVVASILSMTQDPPPLLLANDGAGTFEPAYELNGSEVDSLQRHVVFDVNGDGSLDLVTSRAVYTNDGSGRFAPYTALPSPARRPLGFGDWDADGDLDLLVADGPVAVILDNDGRGRFVPRPGAPTLSGLAIRSVDWDRDGDDDLLALSSQAITLWTNGGGGGLAASTLDTFAGASALAMEVGDFNSDGRPDLALVLTSPASAQRVDVGVLLQDATGNVGIGPYATLFGAYSRLAVADLDGDGRSDLVVSGAAATAVYRQLPAGTFERLFWNLPQGDLVFADFDGDRVLDVLHRGFRVDIYTGDGQGGFDLLPLRQPPTCCRFLWDLTVADLDGDRDLDLLYGARTSWTGAAENGSYVHWNVTRHLRLGGLIAVGGFLDAEVWSALGVSDPTRIALTTIGFARARQVIPGIGAILIDPNGAVSMPWAAFSGSETARSRVPIPVLPSLLGIDLFVQGATLGAAPPELTHVAAGRVHG